MSNKRFKIILQFNKLFFNKINQYIYKPFSTTTLNTIRTTTLNAGHIKDGDVENPIPMHALREEIMKNLGLKAYDPNPESREYLLKFEPKLEDLPPRTMKDSFTSAILQLSKNEGLQRRYISQIGGYLRTGRLLEDMDLFACWVCHKHLHIPKLDPKTPLPYTFVTILVDQVDFTTYRPIYNRDIRLSGHVSWVGRSSMEIVVWLEQCDDKNVNQKITRAIFLMAARNAINTKAAPINPVNPGNDNEKEILVGGNNRKELRSQRVKTSIFNVEPSDIEQKIIHSIFMKTINKSSLSLDSDFLPEKSTWMDCTTITQSTPCFPEKLNVQNTVFGGYLMRIAIETSWICAYRFCGSLPRLMHICDVSFRKPISVSSFIEMTSQVVFTKDNKMQVLTICDALQLDQIQEKGADDKETTNVFELIFYADNNVKQVIPKTYKEAMWYLEGRRKFLAALNINGDDKEEC